MANLTRNCWFVGPKSWGEVLLVMADLTKIHCSLVFVWGEVLLVMA